MTDNERKDILMRATYALLRKCDASPFVMDVMSATAVWDGADCDGSCLMEEIGVLLDIQETFVCAGCNREVEVSFGAADKDFDYCDAVVAGRE